MTKEAKKMLSLSFKKVIHFFIKSEQYHGFELAL